MNLSYLAAQDGLRVLLWDLDPQAAASYLFRIRPRVKGGGQALIRGSREIDDAIKGTDYPGLDLLPADFTYRNLDLVLDATKKPTRRLARLLAPLSADYDVVMLDCPPGISLLSESVLQAADCVLVPLIPTILSVRTLDQLTGFIGELDGRKPGAAGVLLDDRPAQAAAPRDRREAARRARRRGRHRDPGAVADRADVARSAPRSPRSPRTAGPRRPTGSCGRRRGTGPGFPGRSPRRSNPAAGQRPLSCNDRARARLYGACY